MTATAPTRIPQSVFRFYGTPNFALDAIDNTHITFILVSLLNDPFDPYFFLETDFAEKRSALLKFVETNHANDLGWFKRSVTAESWDKTMKELKERVSYWRSSTFLFCTSAEEDGFHPRDSLYMWGHYGNGHRGVAIEFDTERLARDATDRTIPLEGSESVNPAEVWEKVMYTDEMSPISGEEYYQFMKQEIDLRAGKIFERTVTKLEARYRNMTRIKSSAWSAEREWRLMWRNDETRMKIYRCPIGERSIVNLYLGLNLSPGAETDFVVEATRNFPAAGVFKAKKRFGSFGLEFETLRESERRTS